MPRLHRQGISINIPPMGGSDQGIFCAIHITFAQRDRYKCVLDATGPGYRRATARRRAFSGQQSAIIYQWDGGLILFAAAGGTQPATTMRAGCPPPNKWSAVSDLPLRAGCPLSQEGFHTCGRRPADGRREIRIVEGDGIKIGIYFCTALKLLRSGRFMAAPSDEIFDGTLRGSHPCVDEIPG